MGAHFEGALDLFGDDPERDPRERLRTVARSAEALVEHLKRDHRARIVGEVVAPSALPGSPNFPMGSTRGCVPPLKYAASAASTATSGKLGRMSAADTTPSS